MLRAKVFNSGSEKEPHWVINTFDGETPMCAINLGAEHTEEAVVKALKEQHGLHYIEVEVETVTEGGYHSDYKTHPLAPPIVEQPIDEKDREPPVWP